MREWFLSRTTNERRLLIAAAIVAFILLVYTLIASPFLDSLHQHREKAAKQDSLIAWMQETASTIRQQSSSRRVSANSNTPLLTLIDRSARQHRLGSYMHRLEPQGSGTAQIWLKQIPFDNLSRWLQAIHQQYGITVSNAGIQRQAKTGVVDARLVLVGGKK